MNTSQRDSFLKHSEALCPVSSLSPLLNSLVTGHSVDTGDDVDDVPGVVTGVADVLDVRA